MKLTPLDIHHKEFHRGLRGYSEEEVDKFLDEVAEEFERLFKENIDLKEGLEKIRKQLENYQNLEHTLQNTLITAQKSAEEVKNQAAKEAELVRRDAELQAKEIIQDVQIEKQRLESTFEDLRKAEEEFRSKFKSILGFYARLVEKQVDEFEDIEKPEEKAPEEEFEAVQAESPVTPVDLGEESASQERDSEERDFEERDSEESASEERAPEEYGPGENVHEANLPQEHVDFMRPREEDREGREAVGGNSVIGRDEEERT